MLKIRPEDRQVVCIMEKMHQVQMQDLSDQQIANLTVVKKEGYHQPLTGARCVYTPEQIQLAFKLLLRAN